MQVVLITNGTFSFCQFNYGLLDYTSGSSSTGFGGTPAQVTHFVYYITHKFQLSSKCLELYIYKQIKIENVFGKADAKI